MKPLEGRVAVVAGASRGAGRGIALALGDAGATVYVAGRTIRGGPKPNDGAPGTIEDTADEVTARGGVGIPVRTDCTNEDDVAALFGRVEREQDRLDVLANAVYGAADAALTMEQWQAAWGHPFWEESPDAWRHSMDGGPLAYWRMGVHAARIMVPRKKGLIVGVTDGIMGDVPDNLLSGKELGPYGGMFIWDLSHVCINRIMNAMSVELKKHKIAVATLMPGFMQTERVMRNLSDEKTKTMFGFDKSESVEYIGRAVAALAGDPKAIKKTGRIHFVADLAKEYGFTDVDGRVIERFNPAG